jgi:mannose-6-phosphate isomerase
MATWASGLPPRSPPWTALPSRAATPPTSPLPREFSIVVVLGGAGRLVTESGELELRRGRTALVPYAAGEGELEGQLDVLRCLPSEASA